MHSCLFSDLGVVVVYASGFLMFWVVLVCVIISLFISCVLFLDFIW